MRFKAWLLAEGHFDCLDCHKDTSRAKEYYMVQHNLWRQTGMRPKNGMLCIGCLEKRLGRRLNADDFLGGDYAYRPERLSTRLADRLGDRLSPDSWYSQMRKAGWKIPDPPYSTDAYNKLFFSKRRS